MFNNIPAELRALPQWVVWRYEQKPDTVKPTKVPYNPLSGKGADVTDPATWVDFNTAASAVGRIYNGIGFVFSENDPYAFIDLDTPKCAPEELAKYQETQRKITTLLILLEGMGEYLSTALLISQSRFTITD